MTNARKAAILEKLAAGILPKLVRAAVKKTPKKVPKKVPTKPPVAKPPAQSKEEFTKALRDKFRKGDYNRVKIGLT
jgi:hypothetical protein